jgi:hypothetical protein
VLEDVGIENVGFEASVSLPARPSDQNILDVKWSVSKLRVRGDGK